MNEIINECISLSLVLLFFLVSHEVECLRGGSPFNHSQLELT